MKANITANEIQIQTRYLPGPGYCSSLNVEVFVTTPGGEDVAAEAVARKVKQAIKTAIESQQRRHN